MVRIYTYVMLAFFSPMTSCQQSLGVRRTGDQPPPGKCNLFMLGGVSRIHLYECCNNCNEKHSTCDGKTYQSVSNISYCDKCGVDNSKGNGLVKFEFSCGGCKRQTLIDKMCMKMVHKYHLDKSGFCWVYAICFFEYCKYFERDTLMFSNRTIPDTCFDLECGPGETTENCPIDCCRSVNKQCNVDVKDPYAVPPKCCLDSTCCK